MRNTPVILPDQNIFLTNEQERMSDKELSSVVDAALMERGVRGVKLSRVERDGVGCVCRLFLSFNS
jgi:hypothetical protein